MNKLQKLLNEHKDELRPDIEIEFHFDSETKYPLSTLLFDTKFLNLLNWKYTNWNWGYNARVDLEWFHTEKEFSWWYNMSDYHKINLCLLDSDDERIKYLEDNTIDD